MGDACESSVPQRFDPGYLPKRCFCHNTGPHFRALAASSRPISPQRSMVNSGLTWNSIAGHSCHPHFGARHNATSNDPKV
eukprot:5030838-Amphidinium_carterae.1